MTLACVPAMNFRGLPFPFIEVWNPTTSNPEGWRRSASKLGSWKIPPNQQLRHRSFRYRDTQVKQSHLIDNFQRSFPFFGKAFTNPRSWWTTNHWQWIRGGRTTGKDSKLDGFSPVGFWGWTAIATVDERNPTNRSHLNFTLLIGFRVTKQMVLFTGCFFESMVMYPVSFDM